MAPGKFTPGSGVKIKRICFNEARVKKEGSQLTISSQKELCVHDFGTPPTIPTCLSSLFLIDSPLDGEVFPCYNAYLKKAALLNDGVLVSFLTQLQGHLENVQIFLGKIETWLSEPASSTQFLNELFGSGVALIEDVDESMCKPGTEIRDDATCIRCCKPRSDHYRPNDRYHNSPPYKCQGTYEIGLFYVPAPTTLFTANTALMGGEMNMTFDFFTDDGKEKLKTFVAFLKMYD